MEQLYLLYGSLSITVVDGGWWIVDRILCFVNGLSPCTIILHRAREREHDCTTARDVSHRIYQMRIAFSSLPVWNGFITYFSYDYVSFVRCICDCDCGLSLSCVSVSNVSDMRFILYAAAKFTLILLCSLFVFFFWKQHYRNNNHR